MRRFARGVHAAVALLLAGCATAPARDAEAFSLDVLVYNIHAGKDTAGVRNLEQVAEVVRASGAGVVLLQEVDRFTERSGREDQAATLARLTGMHTAFGRAIDHQGGEYGLAVLSRWPISAHAMHPLPGALPDGRPFERRGVLHVQVRHPAGPLHLLNTHLDASRDDQLRLQQVVGVRELAARLERSGARVVAGGDFNATPESPVVARMLADGWRDAWTVCGAGPGHTVPVGTPTRRIDYLFLPAALACDRAEVLPSRASDHRAVRFRVMVR